MMEDSRTFHSAESAKIAHTPLSTSVQKECNLNVILPVRRAQRMQLAQAQQQISATACVYRPCAHDVTGDYVKGLRHFEWQDGARCCVGVGCRGVCGCTNRH